MNIEKRLKKLESNLPDPDSCVCPDAIAWAATPYYKTCNQCGKAIDIKTWKNWDVILPTLEYMTFAFGLRRNDGKPREDGIAVLDVESLPDAKTILARSVW